MNKYRGVLAIQKGIYNEAEDLAVSFLNALGSVECVKERLMVSFQKVHYVLFESTDAFEVNDLYANEDVTNSMLDMDACTEWDALSDEEREEALEPMALQNGELQVLFFNKNKGVCSVEESRWYDCADKPYLEFSSKFTLEEFNKVLNLCNTDGFNIEDHYNKLYKKVSEVELKYKSGKKREEAETKWRSFVNIVSALHLYRHCLSNENAIEVVKMFSNLID